MNILKAIFASSGSSLNAADAQARIDSKQPLLIVDVRQPGEYRTGHIAGAKLIPLNELQRHLNKLPKNKEILCVCRTGSRSGMAVGQLNRAGFNAVNLRGGMIGWQRAGYPVKKGK
jgi:rhodanese-related sulfurtransferase